MKPWIVQRLGDQIVIREPMGRLIANVIPHHGDEPNVPMKDFVVSAQDMRDAARLASAPEAIYILRLILMEIESDPMTRAYFDAHIIRDAQEIVRR